MGTPVGGTSLKLSRICVKLFDVTELLSTDKATDEDCVLSVASWSVIVRSGWSPWIGIYSQLCNADERTNLPRCQMRGPHNSGRGLGCTATKQNKQSKLPKCYLNLPRGLCHRS